MEVNFPPDLETKLSNSAARQGRNPDAFLQDLVAQYFEEEERFVKAVQRGDEALDRGDYLAHTQLGERLKRFL